MPEKTLSEAEEAEIMNGWFIDNFTPITDAITGRRDSEEEEANTTENHKRSEITA